MHGDLGALRREIQREQQAGSLDRGRVVSLAEAVAAREVMSGSGPSGVRRIRVMRGCTLLCSMCCALGPSVRTTEGRKPRRCSWPRERSTTRVPSLAMPTLRAAPGARSQRARRDTRRRSSSGEPTSCDPDERVRRAAFEAALDAPSDEDLEILLESARLDPDPLSQSLAARSVGAVGGERAVLALLDRWDRADEETRIAIVDAWSMPRAYESGGERELVKVAESGSGLPALAAAEGLLRAGDAHAASATTLLARTIADGSAEERRYAIRVAPLENAEVRRLIDEASKDGDSQVKVIALARQLELPGSERALRNSSKSSPRVTRAWRARRARPSPRTVTRA